VLSSAASGTVFPTREVTLAYAKACGGDMAEWDRRWAATAAEIATAKAAVARPATGGPAATWSARDYVAAMSRSSPVELRRASLRPAK
jgi:hypothetical protein